MQRSEQRVSTQTHAPSANQQAAAKNRELFDRLGLLAMNLMCAPGAGKTAFLAASLRAMRGLYRVAVIELDPARIPEPGVPAHQINAETTGRLDAQRVSCALEGFPVARVDLLVIENAGGLVGRTSFDLGESLRVVLHSFEEGGEKPKKYPFQNDKADVVVINKLDLFRGPGSDLDELKAYAREVNPGAIVFPLSARTGEGMGAWTEWLGQAISRKAVRKRDEFDWLLTRLAARTSCQSPVQNRLSCSPVVGPT